jgi:hypothetical protein
LKGEFDKQTLCMRNAHGELVIRAEKEQGVYIIRHISKKFQEQAFHN